ncbi:hypothetical protein WH91_05280 [Devosia psychrophila]|uniref:Uncharacterized protein n=1 Tax=Devosia psychrophila TaxID=728005 RepID=A0ABR5E118_9HYPH|nr:hypothetical protein WH91_05280 [Devosia psychrophila]
MFGWLSDADDRREVERQIDGMAWASHSEPAAAGVIEMMMSGATMRVGQGASGEHLPPRKGFNHVGVDLDGIVNRCG